MDTKCPPRPCHCGSAPTSFLKSPIIFEHVNPLSDPYFPLLRISIYEAHESTIMNIACTLRVITCHSPSHNKLRSTRSLEIRTSTCLKYLPLLLPDSLDNC